MPASTRSRQLPDPKESEDPGTPEKPENSELAGTDEKPEAAEGAGAAGVSGAAGASGNAEDTEPQEDAGKPEAPQGTEPVKPKPPQDTETPASSKPPVSGKPSATGEPTGSEPTEDAKGPESAQAAEDPEPSESPEPSASAEDPGTAASGAPRPASFRARLAHWRSWRGRHPRAARALRWTVTILSAVLVLGALLLPNQLQMLHTEQFLRLPSEAIIAAALLLALPRKPRVAVAAAGGAVLAALTVLNLLDMGYAEYLGRTFNPILDWGLLDDAQSYVADSMGEAVAVGAAVGVVLLVVGLFASMALALVRLSTLLADHRQTATRATLAAGTVWMTCSALGLQYAGEPIAQDRAATALTDKAREVRKTLRDEAAFEKETRVDAFGNTPPAQLLPDLRGKDVIFTFIESYGRVALTDPEIAPGVDRALDTGQQALTKAGYHAKSGWLTSSTFGGGSWLGHSTTMSGLWIDNQQRYRTVMNSDHMSLTKAFGKTGAWDTVGIMPGVQKAWPEQRYYGLDKVYNAFQMGYRGPAFSWSTMPDQYALESFQRLEHGKKRAKPLMAEIILTSSHQPWAPVPEMVDWKDVGDGSVFGSIQKKGQKASEIINDSDKSRVAYGKSVEYSVTALTQWLERYGTDDTVLVFLGDHQPITRVSGNTSVRDVPVSIVAKDPKVLDKIAGWKWTDGLKPAPDAPVWKMNSFRDRFLTAYGSTPHPTK
ncbi:CDP-alcohol phosphatidyltransferase [Streptomyces sp. NPDC006172]|uniref:CDP-alcohol phosphatidyltransferase n=1 Tax=Streptomyces sp. NPDC006172 TaxID=3154470 RepID=UPI0033DAC0BA